MANREIKFRAWDGKVMHVDLYEVEWLTDGSYNINEDVRIAQNGLMQYTGLKDKNGREIYEGDIILHGTGTLRGVGVIRWYEYGAGFKVYRGTDRYDPYDAEVIGNIHENPELIPA